MAVGREKKVGLLGAGYICDLHARSLKARSDIELIAVCDRLRNRAHAAAARHGIAQASASLDELLASNVDVVHVLTPPDQHGDAARRIVDSGRHAFVEKPLATDSHEAAALAELAAARGVRLAANHNFLFLPSALKLRNHSSNGMLGPLDHISIKWMAPLPLLHVGPFDSWIVRQPQNLFLEVGPHLVAFVIALIGRLDEIEARASRPLVLPGGATVYRHWHILGVKGATGVEMMLSVTDGPAVKTVSVRGLAATAQCDFERDTYELITPQGRTLAFENFLAGVGKAGQALGEASKVAVRSLVRTALKHPGQNPFALSVKKSIDDFYAGMDSASQESRGACFAVDVVAESERIARAALREYEHRKPAPIVITSVPEPNNPTVLVFGGTGFIGRHLVRALVDKGSAVRVATRNAQSARITLGKAEVAIAEGDRTDPRFVDEALEGITVVYDLAKFEGRRWEEYYKGEVEPTRVLAERALARGVTRYIYTSSIAAYFSGRTGDIIDSDTPLDERIGERDHYARAKAACEAILLDFHKTRGLPLVIFRPGIVIGDGAAPAHWGVGMFASETVVRLWGNGKNPLPFVLLEDVVSGLLLAQDAPGIEGETFLLVDELTLTAREYVEALSRAVGSHVRAIPTPIWRFYLADLLKEGAKAAIRHPNRRKPSYREWSSRSQRARYDSSKTRRVLGWTPCGSREALIERGITLPARAWLQ